MTILIIAYLVLSLVASLLVYSSFVIAARADRCMKHPPREYDEDESPSQVAEDVEV